jgi:hypothetical protein
LSSLFYYQRKQSRFIPTKLKKKDNTKIIRPNLGFSHLIELNIFTSIFHNDTKTKYLDIIKRKWKYIVGKEKKTILKKDFE